MTLNPITFGFNLFGLAQADQMNQHDLEQIQRQRFQDIFRYAVEHSSFYQNKYKGKSSSGVVIDDLPIVTKKELMAHFNDWVTDPEIKLSSLKKFISDPVNIAKPYLEKYIVWESSGSSGIPGIFLQSTDAMSTYDALEYSRKSTWQKIHQCLDPLCLSDRVAFVGVNSGHFASIVSFKRMIQSNSYLGGRFKSFSILDSHRKLIDQLNDFQPTILVTYPTAAISLAHAQKNGDLSLNLSEVLTGGENLTLTMRKHLKDIFSCKIINSYGASEFLPIAWECDAGRMHINADWVILEPVDENYLPVVDGKLSYTTLLTNLANYVQPLIRYDLGDSVRINKKNCSCGCHLPTIDLQGRGDDILKMRNKKGEWVDLLPLAISTILEDELGIFDFQIKQEKTGQLIIFLSLSQKEGQLLMTKCKNSLNHYLSQQGLPPHKFIEKYDAQMTLGRSGKIKRILCHT